jgi:hypothetical protein
LNDSSPWAGLVEKGGGVKINLLSFSHLIHPSG